ncbi:helix-turn-helix domain-containing protein [Halorubrum sp. DTA98]|uniref:helix-turn-helix domain-containing protein n=1 Tax=Halorubrum sp. DTA98 TaxID=3402163 RepID=UPI003AABED9F
MTVLCDLTVSSADVSLDPFPVIPEGNSVRLTSVIPTGTGPIAYLWIPRAMLDPVMTLLRESPNVRDQANIDRIADQELVRIDLSSDTDGVFTPFNDLDVTVLEGIGTANDWTFRVRFPDRTVLESFRRACSDDGVRTTVNRLYEPSGRTERGGRTDLTPEQATALRTAHESGYFEVPRESSLVELSDEMGISDSALSQRLRRGVDTLLGSTWPDAERNDED